MLQGFVFPGKMWEDKTPLDFRTDKETGLREGLSIKPAGVVKHNLKPGIEGCVIPPLATWRGGKYYEELGEDGKKAFGEYLENWEMFDAYVVTGEFTPGNYVARIYLLPKGIAQDPDPDHPLEWSPALQKGTAITSHMSGSWGPGRPWGTGAGTSTKPVETKPALPPPAPKQVVPSNTRVRCGGCGHWFKLDQLGAHAEYCCPGINGPESDWAFPCECCDTLDEVQTLKPGFPRPKKEEPKSPVKKATKAAAVAKKDEPPEAAATA